MESAQESVLLAMRLEAEERQAQADYELALMLAGQDETSKPSPQTRSQSHSQEHETVEDYTQTDYALALKMQKQDEEETALMLSSATGRAWKLVQSVVSAVQGSELVSPVAIDDMVYTAERFIVAHDHFRKNRKPSLVDIGYHYTRRENLERIRTDGLLTKAERDAENIKSHYNGSSYGDGIYSAHNPMTYQNSYGETGLLVGRLPGVMGSTGLGNCDTRDCGSFWVLKTSQQCLPLVRFNVRAVQENPAQLYEIHLIIHDILDEAFNSGPTQPCGFPGIPQRNTARQTPTLAAPSGNTQNATQGSCIIQ